VFPLLGLGDPQRQAVLLLSSPMAENMERLEHFLANRLARRPIAAAAH
jgi:hypothetical protein